MEFTQKILVTGVTGVSKSTICKLLSEKKYDAHDIEEYPRMFAMYREDTGKPFHDFDNADPEKVKNADWRCNAEVLKKLLTQQSVGISFYCGIASNIDEIIPLFDKIIILTVDNETLRNRLSNRKAEDAGGTEEGREIIIGWKDWWEDKMRVYKAIFVDASGTPQEIMEKILKVI